MATIAVLPGDGIGPEVTAQAVKVLAVTAEVFGLQLQFDRALIGGQAIDETGESLPAETEALCKRSAAVLLGAVGGPKWDNPDAETRPEQGLLKLRFGLGLYANLRPVKPSRFLRSASVIKEEVLEGVDLIVVRELTGGLYFGQPSRIWQSDDHWQAVDTLSYTEGEINRILHKAFQIATSRKRKVTSVDKQNVLSTSRLWRRLATQMASSYSSVTLEHLLVDACSMHLVTKPSTFDVIVTENMFGDILTDEASVLAGSLGMLPSASLGEGGIGLYEPIHGSAPDIAGTDKANPIGTILSGAMLLRYTLQQEAAAQAVEKAVESVLERGYRTVDIRQPGTTLVGTAEMGDLVSAAVRASSGAAGK
ncbi:MAG: 3-isopropylmalate dehydrogenase [Chloroflexi bacterium]|nr:3-isopropylmalate dehydrogenase [Chloroflexota bacterium]